MDKDEIDLLISAARELKDYIDKANKQLRQEHFDYGTDVEYHDYQTVHELNTLAMKFV